MELKARTLRVICAVLDSGSLQIAARRVHLSPSAVSRVVSAFEADLGVALFERRERRLVVTDAGHAFLGHARDALLLLDDLASFGQRGSGPSELRIAALSRHAETLVARAVSRLRTSGSWSGPISLDVHAQRDFAYSRLARPFDIGFGPLAGPHDDLESVVLTQSPLVVVMAPNHPLARRKQLAATDLVSCALIRLASDTVIGTEVSRALEAAPAISVTTEVSHTYIALNLVQAGVGVHITDRLAAAAAHDAGCRCVPLSGSRSVAVRMFWPKRRDGLSDAGRAVGQAIVAELVSRRFKIEASARTRLAVANTA